MGTHPWHEKSHVFPTEAKGFDERLWETEMARQALHLEQTKVRFRVSWMMSTAPLNPHSLLAKLNKFQLKSCRCTSRRCCPKTPKTMVEANSPWNLRRLNTTLDDFPHEMGLFHRLWAFSHAFARCVQSPRKGRDPVTEGPLTCMMIREDSVERHGMGSFYAEIGDIRPSWPGNNLFKQLGWFNTVNLVGKLMLKICAW